MPNLVSVPQWSSQNDQISNWPRMKPFKRSAVMSGLKLQQGQGNVSHGNDGRWTPADNLGDIRCDEDYEAFYRAQLQAGKRLPPPLDSSTVYSELPPHLQQGLIQHQRMMAARSPAPNGEFNSSCR